MVVSDQEATHTPRLKPQDVVHSLINSTLLKMSMHSINPPELEFIIKFKNHLNLTPPRRLKVSQLVNLPQT
jgi:hypothetical protein